MRLSRKAKQIIIVAFAVLAVGGMVLALMLVTNQREEGPRPSAAPTSIPDPTPSEWPSSWPATPAPTETGVVPGDGTFTVPEDVPRTDPEAVARAFAELTVSWDTVTDSGTQEGLERAMPFVAQDSAVVPGGAGIAAGWRNAQEHDAYTLPSAEVMPWHSEGEAPPVYEPTGEQITPVPLEATYKWQGRDGWVSESSASRTVYVSLVDRGGEWVVVDYSFVDPPQELLAE